MNKSSCRKTMFIYVHLCPHVPLPQPPHEACHSKNHSQDLVALNSLPNLSWGMPCSTPKSEEHWLAMTSATLPGKPWSKANQVLINHTLCVDHFIQSFLFYWCCCRRRRRRHSYCYCFCYCFSLLITMIDHYCSLWLLSLSLCCYVLFLIIILFYCYGYSLLLSFSLLLPNHSHYSHYCHYHYHY